MQHFPYLEILINISSTSYNFIKKQCIIKLDLSKAETQALTNYGSGEDENEDEEIEEFEEGPVDVQTSLQANTEITEENEHDDQVLAIQIETHIDLILTTLIAGYF